MNCAPWYNIDAQDQTQNCDQEVVDASNKGKKNVTSSKQAIIRSAPNRTQTKKALKTRDSDSRARDPVGPQIYDGLKLS